MGGATRTIDNAIPLPAFPNPGGNQDWQCSSAAVLADGPASLEGVIHVTHSQKRSMGTIGIRLKSKIHDTRSGLPV